ncbi:MlaD family protein [Ottowia thiooxydans]|uniref:Phospholipid/cholesterol/gamma-HCH transport system substrate-binding protein n=1 Tax=Ottowia thiooxydans TaxID=219182 RepID=A0ABV2Q2Q9_9BURK
MTVPTPASSDRSNEPGSGLPEQPANNMPDGPPEGSLAWRRLEFRAAVLLIFMVLLLGGAVLYLMWVRGAFEATQRLVLTTDDSEGVSVGMDMTFSGFPIGRVSRIELGDAGVVRILVDIPLKDAPRLRQSSVFTLEKGIVGAARLRAFTGVPDDEPLPTDAERVVLRGDVSAEIPKMVADARDVLQNLNRLTSAESALAGTMVELRSFTARLNSEKGGLLAAVTGNEADAKQVTELLARTNQLLKSLDSVATRVDGVVQKADQQVLGKDGLITDAQAAVKQLNSLLQDARQTVVKVDAVLKDVQSVAGNAAEATNNLGDLRADVESSLLKIDSLITEINRKWPFAPKEKEVKLP